MIIPKPSRTMAEIRASIAARKKNGTYIPMEEFMATARKQRLTWEEAKDRAEKMVNVN